VAIIEKVIDGSGVDDSVTGYYLLNLLIIGIQHDLNIGMGKHLIEHFGVPMQRHCLESICKVPIVLVGSDRDSRNHRSIQLTWVQVPLFMGVSLEELLVQFPAYLTDHDILGGPDLFQLFSSSVIKFLQLATA